MVTETEAVADEERTRKLDDLTNEWLDLKAEKEKLELRLRELADQLIDEIGVGNRHEIMSGVGVRVQRPASVFRAERAEAVLNPEQIAAITVPTISGAVAKEMLPPALYKQLTVPNAHPSVIAL